MAAREKLASYRMPEVSSAFQHLSGECRDALEDSRRLRRRLRYHLDSHPVSPLPPEPAA